jgi:hypothetical protein
MQSVSVPILALHGDQDIHAPIERVKNALTLLDRSVTSVSEGEHQTEPLTLSVPSPAILPVTSFVTASPTQRRLIKFLGTGRMLPPNLVGHAILAFIQSHEKPHNFVN